ncbi:MULTISPECIES: hypothetical protein [unclassified Halorhodospira]|uniref:hypothetical protein n=1 Tax=unclassified Halorhodospira TaxID=2626748 RepID=UPI001EE79CE1|nr:MULTISPECIES: hypothetical protein [unclassified Halorhodospira]MCG5541422.1 hypothetical protein [Halorhodospira sp. M39old]MCG5546416.1 hypothetical protein [Halorhodospira sp. M38]
MSGAFWLVGSLLAVMPGVISGSDSAAHGEDQLTVSMEVEAQPAGLVFEDNPVDYGVRFPGEELPREEARETSVRVVLSGPRGSAFEVGVEGAAAEPEDVPFGDDRKGFRYELTSDVDGAAPIDFFVSPVPDGNSYRFDRGQGEANLPLHVYLPERIPEDARGDYSDTITVTVELED